MTYAKGTSVRVEKTQGDLVKVLEKAGAVRHSFGRNGDLALVQFEIKETQVMMSVPLPLLKDSFKIPGRWKERTGSQAQMHHEQLVRERWRQVLLLVKAKLEAVAIGMTTIEREFLADVRTADGTTVHQMLKKLTGAEPIAQSSRYLLGPAS